MSTRLFPKRQGATAYRLTGVAARCDWVVLTDYQSPLTHVVKQRNTNQPRHVFLSMRAPFIALRFFVESVLPEITNNFVLISGSEDATVPTQTDRRWRAFDATERGMIDALLATPRLRRWFAENLDACSHPKFSPLPLGRVFPDGPPREPIVLDGILPLSARPLTALCLHRLWPGPQWHARRSVSLLSRTAWREFCVTRDSYIPEANYEALLRKHAFVLCVEGGGIDPSPKAWQALMWGAIPIVRRTTLEQAYARLPVAFVDAWDADTVSPGRLRCWSEALQPMFDVPHLRATVLERLRLDYWWNAISAEVPDTVLS